MLVPLASRDSRVCDVTVACHGKIERRVKPRVTLRSRDFFASYVTLDLDCGTICRRTSDSQTCLASN